MPFDGIALYAAINEIKSQILGHTINKIYQPKNDQLIISFRHGIEEKFLLVSANPNNCRIHLADNLPDNPSTPPMFCMLLRKNLLGGKLTNVNQLGLERVVEFTVQNKNEFMKQVEYKLLVEIMGKHSNIILVDNSTNRIIDCIKRITSDVNRYRQILPNRQYVFPPIGEKCNFLLIDKKHILSLILPAIKANTQKNISSWILENIMGLSGRTAKEIVKRADVEDVQIGFISNDKLYKVIDALADLREQVKANSFFPTIYYEPKSLEPVDFWVFPMSLRDGYIAKISDSVNKAVDRYYFLKEQADALKSRNTSLTLQISKFIEKKSKNIYLIKTRLSETDEMNKYKLWGEILSAYLYLIKPGVNKVKLANFYEPGHDIEIPLNKKMTPAQNAQHYFNKYKKLQSAKAIIKKRLKKMQQEMEYLESVLVNAQNC
ncbi:MAG: fibronectin/fibrinogen-binding protein, partial [Thermoanaerobacterales bacterium]|nr:fibronectin/fibrinogen-binding protein [Thermoanaerobacterales bacterium]